MLKVSERSGYLKVSERSARCQRSVTDQHSQWFEIYIFYFFCLSKSLGHSRVPCSHPICFPSFIVLKPHIIQIMCFETPM